MHRNTTGTSLLCDVLKRLVGCMAVSCCIGMHPISS